jgi:hypothetical protein
MTIPMQRWSKRALAGAALALALAGFHPGPGLAQAPPAAPRAPGAAPPAGAPAAPAAPAAPTGGGAGGGAGQPFVRLVFLVLDEWSYTAHPYGPITGNPSFADGHAAGGTTLNVAVPETDAGADPFEQLLHSLPPFAVEWGQTIDLVVPKGFSFGFEYMHFPQRDKEAASGGTVAPIVTDTYLYNLALRFYAFDPNSKGINYFAGFGLGLLDGKMLTQPLASSPPEIVHFSGSPTGATRLGLEAKGDNVGFRYELILLNANKVSLTKNPYAGQPSSPIDFSGAIIRLAMFYQFD